MKGLRSVGTWACSVLGVSILASCGSMSEKKSDAVDAGAIAGSGATGCIHGSVYNGLTGEPIGMRSFDGTSGLAVLVRNQMIGASGISGGGERELVDGYYSVCGIPTDEDYALFVRQDGYQAFTGTVHIDSTAKPKNESIETHLFKSAPTQEANIVLYPVGTRTQDLIFTVVYDGAPVQGATVQLRPTGHNVLQGANLSGADMSNFESRILAPRDIRLKTLVSVTDANGNATFSKDDLVLGGKYNYVILPPDSLPAAMTAIDTAETVVVGLQVSGSASQNPYRYRKTLSALAVEVTYETSGDSETARPDGSLSIVFNRPVEIVSHADAHMATLANAVDAALFPEVPGNAVSDTVNFVLSSDGTVLTLTPKFKSQPTAAREPALSITYSGFQVRAASAPKNAKYVPVITAKAVKFFGADTNPTLLASKIQKSADSDGQTASISTLLANPIVLTVYDQFGIALKNQTVSFAIATGGGSLKKVLDATYASSVSVVTDASGVATVQWALGTTVGEQTLSARVGSLDLVTFRAVGTN